MRTHTHTSTQKDLHAYTFHAYIREIEEEAIQTAQDVDAFDLKLKMRKAKEQERIQQLRAVSELLHG